MSDGGQGDLLSHEQHERNREHLADLRRQLAAKRPADMAPAREYVPPPPADTPAAPAPSDEVISAASAERRDEPEGPTCLLCTEPGTAGTGPMGERFCATHWDERKRRIGAT